ncbi:MAG: HlyD family secretion protein [Verrucomicrobia bacterium]|nr:HlyD family secretion protein [Verrucomicrobiota bacterium]
MFKGIFVRYKVTIAFCVLVIVLLLIRVWRPHEEVVFDRSQGQDAQPVHTLVVSPSKFADEVITTGTLRAYENIDLQVEVPGKLVYIGFVEGAEVARGTLLLRVDDSELQAELRRTERRRDLAALSERRLAPLVAAGGISESQYDEAATQLSIFGRRSGPCSATACEEGSACSV